MSKRSKERDVFQPLEFLDEEWSWQNLSLEEYIQEGNYPKLCEKWQEFFERSDIKEKIYKISERLEYDVKNDITIFPSIHHVFRAFIPLEKIKVVILGQDPYHNGSAMGLCFSVMPGNSINPSLRNIYAELKQEKFTPTEDGNLTSWADQGCLLLNSALTVRKGEAEAHLDLWHPFTEYVLRYIGKFTTGVAWIFMGAKAVSFLNCMPDTHMHEPFITSHPSPYSASKSFRSYPAFLGSHVFQDVNKWLEKIGKTPIEW